MSHGDHCNICGLHGHGLHDWNGAHLLSLQLCNYCYVWATHARTRARKLEAEEATA